MRTNKLLLALLAALTIAALALRLRGIGFGLPLQVEDDCKIPHQVEVLRSGEPGWRADREFRWYPLFTAHIARLWPAAEPAPEGASLDEHLAAAAAPHVQVRTTVALLAVLAVPLTYVLASWFLARRWALVAAAFLAFSLLHQSFSQQSRPHAVAGTLMLAAVMAAVWLRRSGDAFGYLAAGGVAALALGCLQSGAAVLPALLVAHLAGPRRWFDPRALLALAAVALALPVFYPFLLFDGGAGSGPAVALDLARWKLTLGGHEIFLDQFFFGGLKPLAWSLWSYEPVLLALALVAALLWSARRIARRKPASCDRELRRDAWVVLAFALPYALALALYERTYERFALPLLPFLALAAAWALRELAHAGGRWIAALREPKGQAALAALALAAPLAAAWCLASVRAQPSTMAVAGEWVRANAAPDDDVALTSRVELPLCRRPEGFDTWMGAVSKSLVWVWSRYQAALPEGHGPEPLWRLRWWRPKLELMGSDPAAYVAGQGGKLLVAEVFAEGRGSVGSAVHAALRRGARLRARISPDGDEAWSEHPLGYQEETTVSPPHFFARVLRARRTGPVLEIFELPAD